MSFPRTNRILALMPLGAVLLLGQTPGKVPPATPTFKSTTRIVLVDVVVTDSSGKPVRDLKARDFTVLDEGKPQRIVAFEEQRSDATPRPPVALHLPDQVYTNYVTRSEPGALTILLFDSLNTDRMHLTNARNKMLDFLKRLPAGKRVALYALGSQLRMVQNFTENPDELMAAAEQLSTQSHWTYSNAKELSAAIGELQETDLRKNPTALRSLMRSLGEEYEGKLESRTQYTLDGLTELAHALAVVPGRKNLVWISGGFPFDLSSNAPELQRVAALLAATRIAVYPVDVRGIAVTSAEGQTRDSEIFAPVQTQSYETLSGQDEENAGIIEAMENMARITGGQAHVNSNDLEGAIADSVETGADYYSLAYRPAGVEWHGQFRKITIKASRRNVKLLHRSGYYAFPDISGLREDSDRMVAMAMQPSVPVSTQLIMKARVVAPETAGAATKVDILIDVHDLGFTEEKGQKTPDTQFVAVAWDGNGKQCGSFSEGFHAGLSPAQFESLLRTGLQLHQEMVLKPGTYQLRLGVMDRLAGRIGTLDVPLKIETRATAK